MKRILITGGAGFIGSNLTKKLLEDENNKVICLDNFDPFYSTRQKELNVAGLKANERFKFIEGSIRSMDDLNKAKGIDVIVHLAAKTGVRPSIHEPGVYYDVNVKGTQTLLEFAKQQKIKQFVFGSSSSVYGINKNVPWKENENLLPISPYASTKLSCEMLGHVYHHLYGIRFIALRFFTVYGPAQRPDLAIHKFFKSILNDKSIPVFGDGTTNRDYTFVDDIVKGIVSAISYTGSGYEIINLGNHKTIELHELIKMIESISGKKAVIEKLPEQPGDVSSTYADISKAKNLLGYDPQTNLKDGLKSFYNWYTANASKI